MPRVRFVGGLATRCGTELVVDGDCVSVSRLRELLSRVCDEDPSDLGASVIASGRIVDLEDPSGEEICSDVVIVPLAGGG